MIHTPRIDVMCLTTQLGEAWGVTRGESIAQYLEWSDRTGLISSLEAGPMAVQEIAARTALSEIGADALVCILASLGVVERLPEGAVGLALLGAEYLSRSSPFFIGPALFYACGKPLPAAFDGATPGDGRGGSEELVVPVCIRMGIQHARNFGPSVVAARRSEFREVAHLLDVGGGTGVMAIPLAMDRPDVVVTILEAPEAAEASREMLRRYGCEDRVRVVGCDVLIDDWHAEGVDGVFFGNLFHFVDDESCRRLCQKSYEVLPRGGRLWLHEVLFNQARDGPLLAALWNANMIVRKAGARQRTAAELLAFVESAGFGGFSHAPTAGGYSLVSAVKL